MRSTSIIAAGTLAAISAVQMCPAPFVAPIVAAFTPALEAIAGGVSAGTIGGGVVSGGVAGGIGIGASQIGKKKHGRSYTGQLPNGVNEYNVQQCTDQINAQIASNHGPVQLSNGPDCTFWKFLLYFLDRITG